MENPEIGGLVGGAGGAGPAAELSRGGAENWDTGVLKAAGAAGSGTGLWGGAIVETVAEGTNGREAEVVMAGGTADAPAGKGGE